MLARPATRTESIPLYLLTAVLGVFTFAVRYSAPEGAFGGLTDDHFYFVTQGWQMLFGEWPDRDYFEPGAPLMLLISAVLQLVGGRNIWSEYVFCTAAIAAGSAATFFLATRASGSLLLGVFAWLLQFAMLPRLYGYPKIIVYAAAIGGMWSWATSPRWGKTWALAAIAVVGFLLRHDHGIYVAVAFGVLLCAITGMPLLERAKHGGLFAGAICLLLLPYLAYLQLNGGIDRHFQTTYAWSVRDYARSPRVLPTFEEKSLSEDSGADDAGAAQWWERAPFSVMNDHSTFWLFWLFNALPLLALAMLAVRPAEGPPNWIQERAKILIVIVLAMILDYRFLRGNLAGRLADVSVPIAILAAWLVAAMLSLGTTGRLELGRHGRRVGPIGRAVLAGGAVAIIGITVLALVRPFGKAIETARVMSGPGGTWFEMGRVTERLQNTWPLDGWARDGRADFVLARYLQTCTSPGDRVLLTEFRPQILGLAQRAFAGGHVDMRSGGFFGTEAEQQLTIERWDRESVPVVIGPTEDDYEDWVEGLPLVARYLNREYTNLGEREIDGFAFLLFVRRDAAVVRTFQPFDLPCFR